LARGGGPPRAARFPYPTLLRSGIVGTGGVGGRREAPPGAGPPGRGGSRPRALNHLERGLAQRPGRRATSPVEWERPVSRKERSPDRKSTRLNSSHVKISYAVCC